MTACSSYANGIRVRGAGKIGASGFRSDGSSAEHAGIGMPSEEWEAYDTFEEDQPDEWRDHSEEDE